jgi:hypothetical protein
MGVKTKRNALNTPVVAVVMELGALTPGHIQGQRVLLTRAARVCGRATARASSAILFTDALGIPSDPPITLFVVRGLKHIWVYEQ